VSARSLCAVLLCALPGALSLAPGVARAEAVFGGRGTSDGQFSEANGIAVDQQTGDLYLVDTANERVEKFTGTGDFVLAWGWGVADGRTQALQTCRAPAPCFQGIYGAGAGELGFAEGVAVDNVAGSASDHDVYVVDVDSYRVEKFSPTGRFLAMFGGQVNASARERGETSGEDVCPVRPGDRCTAGAVGSGPGEFDFRVEGDFIAVGATGVVYVGDHNRVQEFDADGRYESQLALVPSVPGGGEEGGTLALAVDPAGDVYAVRYGIKGVQRYTPQGALALTLDAQAEPEDDESPTPSMALDPEGHLFLDYHLHEQHHMLEYARSGEELASFDAGMEDGVHGMAFGDRAGRLYVVAAIADEVVDVRIVTPPVPRSALFSSFRTLPWFGSTGGDG